MSKTYMKQAYAGLVGDMKNLEHHFSCMAEKGWMIDKIGAFTHRYRAVEPCKKRFFVDFLPQISAFDYPENETAQDYRSICESSGWTFITASKQFHVFCADNDAPAPMPIHTDNKIEAQIYLKASKKYELPWMIYAMVMLLFASPFNRGAEVLLSNLSLFYGLGLISFFVGYLWTFLFMISWFIRTRKSAKNGLPMPIANYRLARIRNNMLISGTAMFMVLVITGVALEIIGGKGIMMLFVVLIPLLSIGVGIWVRRQVDTKRRTRGGNIKLFVVTIIILEVFVIGCMVFMVHNIISSQPSYSDAHDDLPALALSDVGVTTEPDNSGAQIKGTVAVPLDYEIWESGEGSVATHVYQTVNGVLTQWLYDYFAKDFTRKMKVQLSGVDDVHGFVVALTAEEAAFWGAENGMRVRYSNSDAVELLLLSSKTILWISADSEAMDLEKVNTAVRNCIDSLRYH